MPFLFTHVEYCDMHYVYGYCDGNASAAVNEYRRRYPERRMNCSKILLYTVFDQKRYSYERFFIGRGKIGVNFNVG